MSKNYQIGDTEYLPDKWFKWEFIQGRMAKTGLLKKKKKGKEKSGDSKFFCLYYNYLIWIKPAKGPGGAPTDKEKTAEGVIPLEAVPESFKIDMSREAPNSFDIPLSTGETIYLMGDDEGTCNEWIKVLRQTVDKLKAVPKREHPELVDRKLREVTAIFPENSFSLPLSVDGNQAEKWFKDMLKYREEYKKWSPFVLQLTLYAEFSFGRTRGYLNWFTNITKGVFETINNSEESVLKSWEKEITTFAPKVDKATEVMFFKEDLTSIIKEAEGLIKAIEVYNTYKKEIFKNEAVFFQAEKEAISLQLQKLGTYPFSKDVSVEEYSGGDMLANSAKRQVFYNRETFSIVDPGTGTEWSFEGHHFQLLNLTPGMYGSVLWNNKSWVWTHPKCPYILRYDWYPSKGVFKQNFPTDSGSQRKLALPPALSDWQIAPHGVQAVSVGKRDPAPEPPSIAFWSIKGSIPPPAVLLVANFEYIQNIVHQLLGIVPDQAVITGLNPVF